MIKNESSRTVVAVLFVVVVAAAFWLILVAPKRDKANELKDQAAMLTTELSAAQAKAEEAKAAKNDFAKDYNQLLQLGKAVPADAATSSLLLELEALGGATKTGFVGISLSGEGESEASAEGEGSALPPLGAQAGPSGLLTMPYSLEYAGGFFQVADFMEGLDSLVQTKNGEVTADGRLVTIDNFELAPQTVESSGRAVELLKAHFSVSTYVTPPGQGLTAGATSAGPEAVSYEE
jgi:Tfp pilus assembly protein PilO